LWPILGGPPRLNSTTRGNLKKPVCPDQFAELDIHNSQIPMILAFGVGNSAG